MKYILWNLILALVLVLGVSAGGQDVEPGILLVTIGEADCDMVEQIRAWTAEFLGVPVRVEKAAAKSATDSDAELDRLKGLRDASNLLVVGLGVFPEKVAIHGEVRPEDGTAIINLTALDRNRDEDKPLAWRVQKEVMRATGLLIGLPLCPNPRCALHPYRDMSQLDQLGLNYCPPCMVQSLELLKQQGFNPKNSLVN